MFDAIQLETMEHSILAEIALKAGAPTHNRVSRGSLWKFLRRLSHALPEEVGTQTNATY